MDNRIKVGNIYSWEETEELFKIISIYTENGELLIRWASSSDGGVFWVPLGGISSYKYDLLVESLDDGICELFQPSNTWSLTPFTFM